MNTSKNDKYIPAGIEKLTQTMNKTQNMSKSTNTGGGCPCVIVWKNGLLFISIPYDKGWNIYVDGKKVPYKKLASTFIGIDLKKGQHKIKMKFYPRGLIVGLLINFISILITILYSKKTKIVI